MATPITQNCRFCYSYKPQGFIQPCCPPVVSADLQTLASISCTTFKVNNNINNTDQTMLLSRQACLLQKVQHTTMMSTVQSTIANAAAINSSMYSQLLDIKTQRYAPYQPYIPPFIPSSVMELRQNTANTGNPMPPITIMNCKGSQFVTK